jgi:succinate dehydrogenase/fumarate reductase flavoprotein subunit
MVKMQLKLDMETFLKCIKELLMKILMSAQCVSTQLFTTPWVDYGWIIILMSTIPGLHVLGEANFSDHGANRLGASALMQGLADGYFVIPYTLGDYFANNKLEKVDTEHEEFKKAEKEAKTE